MLCAEISVCGDISEMSQDIAHQYVQLAVAHVMYIFCSTDVVRNIKLTWATVGCKYAGLLCTHRWSGALETTSASVDRTNWHLAG